MKAMHIKNAVVLVIIVIVLCSLVRADYEITWNSIDGGGGTSNGGPYTLTAKGLEPFYEARFCKCYFFENIIFI